MADKTIPVDGQVFKSVDPATAQIVFLPDGQILRMPAAAAGGGPTVSPLGQQFLDRQFSAIAAARLNGVLQ